MVSTPYSMLNFDVKCDRNKRVHPRHEYTNPYSSQETLYIWCFGTFRPPPTWPNGSASIPAVREQNQSDFRRVDPRIDLSFCTFGRSLYADNYVLQRAGGDMSHMVAASYPSYTKSVLRGIV